MFAEVIENFKPVFYVLAAIYGLVIGSFLNVCILRIPLGQSIAKERSHCMKCGHVLQWYELFPLFSYLFLRGRCKSCGAPISKQYPIVEGANALIYLLIFWVRGFSLETVIFCFTASALIVLTVIDFRTFEIPVGINIFIAVMGLLRLLLNLQDFMTYLTGAVSIGIPLALLFYLSGGRAIGGGDVKLMTAAGFLLGWKLIWLAFILGCIIGSVCHTIRMRVTKESHVLAFGPYLAMGILLSILWGESMIAAYLRLFW